MSIVRRRFTISLVLVASLLLSPVASAQNAAAPTHDWSALSAVTRGSKLEVKLKDGKTVKGKLSGVSDTALSLSVKNKPVDLKREDVASVYEVSAKSATKATLIGMGVGAAAGAVIGTAGSSRDTGFDKIDRAITAGLTIIGAGAGALTGYLIGRGGHKRVLIYEARQP
ncbi:MAG: hypothetical protein QOH63_154 [Acidobacteriota bacterium]|jgi:hypothetical protein|nr:hypothetical protein [Acidobacteriota bacterium]